MTKYKLLLYFRSRKRILTDKVRRHVATGVTVTREHERARLLLLLSAPTFGCIIVPWRRSATVFVVLSSLQIPPPITTSTTAIHYRLSIYYYCQPDQLEFRPSLNAKILIDRAENIFLEDVLPLTKRAQK